MTSAASTVEGGEEQNVGDAKPPKGPGNHPGSESHPAHDHPAPEARSSLQSQAEDEEEQGEKSQQAAPHASEPHRKGTADSHVSNGKDPIERALGPHGPVAARAGQGTALGDADPGQTARHAHAAHPHQAPDAQQHSEKGPIWASKPDDAQREKIRRLQEQKSQSEKHHHFRLGLGRTTREKAEEHKMKEADKDAAAQQDDHASSPSQLSKLNLKFGGSHKAKQRPGSSPSTPSGATQTQGGQPASKRQGSASSAGATRPSLPKQTSQWSKNHRSMRSAMGGPLTAEPEEQDAPADASAGQASGAQKSTSTDSNTPGQAADKLKAFAGRASARKSGSSTPKIGPSRQATQRDGSADADAEGSAPQSPSHAKMVRLSKLMLGGDSGGSGTPDAATENENSTDQPPQTPGAGAARWGALRQRLQQSQALKKRGRPDKVAAAGPMNVVTELQSGILPVFLLKMSLERDEQKNRRIPVLLNHLKLRITDSVNPLHNTHAVFRIELEYGDGLVRWVCYRELRDFINLHAHYRAAALRGYLGRPVGQAEGDLGLPSFPKTSLPYLNQLQRQPKSKDGINPRADFAKAQRDALEDYVLELIRRTMFRPEANRLCKFFELSALSISLASRGGYQGKQGYLRIMSRSSRKDAQKGLLTPASLAKSYSPKWFIVRESYIVAVDEPASLQVHDVFLIDGDFEIERPKRLYKQTIHLASELGHHSDDEKTEKGQSEKARASHTALLTDGQYGRPNGAEEDDDYSTKPGGSKSVSSHTFYIKNAQQRMKLVAKSERLMTQFIASLERVAARNIFSGSNRFGSFAPIRLNCSAQWLVDGRDYYWNLSKALLMAKDRIFIHDWWLSPEMYLRRPGTPKYRLDNILKKKASEGVKIFVILYNEVSNNFTPTDSNYTKQRLIGLHPNIFVQRSPSHFQTGTFYWAHHEKLCVIDETIAFMGGLDLCFGRWDTAEHILSDDAQYDAADGNVGHVHLDEDPSLLGPGRNGAEAQIWPGQDYANERVMEWHDLTKPANDLIDRTQFPRMPWHDVGVQLVGQPARDLCRHFAQRWNFLLRIKNHKRVMPFLIPPPDFVPSDLSKYQLTGTCEAQICRSAGPWSMGTPTTVEHSIQNAYLKAIQMSDHFVYIENQFFVTSTVVRGTEITNKIGEALVSRIVRAHREGTPWRAIIVIPLIPGFPMPIDHPDAGSVRLIVECQNRSICRGEHSIFGKLKRQGINPDDYITFFSLRQWGKLRGGKLCTEIGYIHAKTMIVDDRLALIGSANINERSQRGDRDSELAVVIRDTDMIDSTMGGQAYKVGRFAHTLRMRLMREHLGIDVDKIEQQEASEGLSANDTGNRMPAQMADHDEDEWDPSNEQRRDGRPGIGQTQVKPRNTFKNLGRTAGELVSGMSTNIKTEVRSDGGKAGSSDRKPEKDEAADQGAVERVEEQLASERVRGAPNGHARNSSTSALSTFSQDNLRNKSSKNVSNPWAVPSDAPVIDPYGFEDPISDEFFHGSWLAAAQHNTDVFRKVFKATPDDQVTTWAEYKAYQAWYDRLMRSSGVKPAPPSGAAPIDEGATPFAQNGKMEASPHGPSNTLPLPKSKESGMEGNAGPSLQQAPATYPRGGPKLPDDGFSTKELEQMEALLHETRGTLVMHSTRFLEAEDLSDNFLFAMDRINPLNVYD
ncbi:Phospholipase D1 [Ceraceosorus bombacis]|uniref:Phospholipase n=1 Tax=Ceraceosorus bombacis TaxID=401625 RepID=A0A0P1BRK8_9BASI|nr:Phospholipase D1 [Ceraceosorus bombacis]